MQKKAKKLEEKERQQLELHRISRENITDNLERLLELEPYWTSAGETEWTRENFMRNLPGKFSLSFYVEDQGKMAGYFIASESGMVGKLHKIIVHPNQRGNGIGARLWNAFVNESRQRGIRRLEFKVLPENQSAINLYRKNGCVFSGTEIGSDGKERHNVFYTFRPLIDIPHSYTKIYNSDVNAVVDQLMSGNLSTGSVAGQLASRIAKLSGKKYGVATNSGTNALFIALRALEIGDGSEVIIPSYACDSLLHAVENTGAVPVFVDLAENGFNLPSEKIGEKLTENTRAIVYPHLFGQVSGEVALVKGFGVPVIEDCAQVLGASYDGIPVGSFGDVSVFSFYPTKMISAPGGGVAATNNDELAFRMKSLLRTDKKEVWNEAHSMGMDDISASIALSQIGKLESFVSSRRAIAEFFNKSLEGAEYSLPEEIPGNVFSRYVVRHPEAEEIIKNLNRRGIHARNPVHSLLHRHLSNPIYDHDSHYPCSVKAYNEAISIPIHPLLPEIQAIEITGAMLNWRSENGK